MNIKRAMASVGVWSILSAFAFGEGIVVSIEAEGGVRLSEQVESAPVDWSSNEASEVDSRLAIDASKNELTVGVELINDRVQLQQLSIDLSRESADWTLGRKPQTWAFSYSSEALNWLYSETLVLREQYFPMSSLQTFCAFHSDADNFCGTRWSGWWNAIDWQVSARYSDHWETTAALQGQWLAGGLSYVEWSLDESVGTVALTQVAPDTYQAVADKASQLTATVGVQWTSATQTALLAESNYRSAALGSSSWDGLRAQLTEPTSGLVANALSSPFGRWQHVVRLSQDWSSVGADINWVVWPDAFDSWLIETNLTFEISTRQSVSVQHSYHDPKSLLALTGSGHSVRFAFEFKDGI